MTNGISTLPQPITKKAYGFFTGAIDQQAVQRVSNGLTLATNNGVSEIHMLFQSTGEIVGDGICIYNIFQSIPLKIHLYNAGSVASIAVIAYLGADVRKSTSNATFMIHKTYFSPPQATAERLQSAANAALLDDGRIESILHQDVKLSDEKWEIHRFADLWLSADEALETGLVTEIGNFHPPLGDQLFYLGPP